MMKRPLKQMLCVGLLGLALGCGGGAGKGPAVVKVRGTVQMDGTPLSEGDIIFRRSDGDQKGFGGQIHDGKYEIETEPGTMAVAITAMRVVPGKFHTENVTPEPVTEMYIPAKYNSKSTLTVTIDPVQKTPVPFDLSSK